MYYEAIRTGQYYAIVCDGVPVRSALGRAYLTGYRLLADDLCDDLKLCGLPAAGSASLAALHSNYLDHGANVPRGQLESDVLTRYDRALDFALDRPQERTTQAMMSAWFGPVASLEAFSAWLHAASVRQLVSMIMAIEVSGSALVAYRLLRGELPAPRLAAGVRKYDRAPGYGVTELTLILEKVRRYAQVPEEPELIAGTQLDLEMGDDGAGVH